MHGTSPHGEHLYIVGRQGTVLYYNEWAVEAVEVGTTVDLYGVWVENESSIRIVGDSGTVVTWDGSTWTVEQVTTADLRAVHGGPAGLFAVGTGGTIVQYESGAWRESPSGTGVTLRSVWSGDDRVFVVGDAGTILEIR